MAPPVMPPPMTVTFLRADMRPPPSTALAALCARDESAHAPGRHRARVRDRAYVSLAILSIEARFAQTEWPRSGQVPRTATSGACGAASDSARTDRSGFTSGSPMPAGSARCFVFSARESACAELVDLPLEVGDGRCPPQGLAWLLAVGRAVRRAVASRAMRPSFGASARAAVSAPWRDSGDEHEVREAAAVRHHAVQQPPVAHHAARPCSSRRSARRRPAAASASRATSSGGRHSVGDAGRPRAPGGAKSARSRRAMPAFASV